MEYRIKEWDPTTGAEVRTLGFLKSVNYQANCNNTSDMRYGNLLNESLVAEVFNSTAAQIQQGAWVSFEIRNNPAAMAGWNDTEYTFYGIYKVDNVKNANGYYTFTAYPSTHDLNVDYSDRLKELADGGSFPMSMEDLCADACSYIGMSFNRGTAGSSLVWFAQMNAFYANGITVKDILCAAAELVGANVRDVFGASNASPTAPLATQRGVILQEYSLRENTKTDNTTGYYLIAPTDAPVDTSAFSGTLFSNVYYKENGLTSGDAITPLSLLEVVSSNGAKQQYQYIVGGTENIYRITNNILYNNIGVVVGGLIPYAAIQNALGTPILHPTTVRLFPFFCPFRCGDKANVTNGNGISYQMPVMSLVINDNEAILSCTGNALYETAQNQYSTADQSTQNNAVEIGKLRTDVDALDSFARGAIVTINMAAGTDYNFILDDGARFALFTAGSVDTARALYIFNTTNSTGAVTYSAVKSGSAITLTTGTNSLTVRSTNVGAMGFFVFRGRVTPTT